MLTTNDLEFEAVFQVTHTGALERVEYTSAPYVPTVEHDDEHDMLIDGVPYTEHPDWEPFTVGYTGQYSYRGPVMHPSEYVGGRLERDLLDTSGTYALAVVEVVECDYLCESDCQGDHEPAGWTILRLKDES